MDGLPPVSATLTDLYELTMAYGYWKLGRADERAVFSLFFRHPPFGGGFTVAGGLERVIDFVERFHFTDEELEHLGSLRADDGTALFEAAFLEHLRGLGLEIDLDAIPEGTAVFPYEPILRVRGPLLQAQLVETTLLNLVNFPSLVATKAAHVVLAAGGAPVLEFGLRRAQGPDGALTASRAAYLGGCAATSNVEAGRRFGIPVRGTHAHSWVLSFEDEQQAFDAYAAVMPSNAVLLVDTYDTLAGVGHAIETGRRMRERGQRLGGIRLDSGDLAYLSQRARAMLDEAGFTDTRILASNDLDPETIESLNAQGARIDTWGVGTRLVTAFDQPALGGVYKLVAIEGPGGWRLPIKVSSDSAKTGIPGLVAVRRFRDRDGTARADMLYDELSNAPAQPLIVDPADPHHRHVIEPDWTSRELLVPVFEAGRRVYDPPSLEASRELVRQEIGSLHPAILRLLRPHWYPAGLEYGLHRRREELIESELAAEATDGRRGA